MPVPLAQCRIAVWSPPINHNGVYISIGDVAQHTHTGVGTLLQASRAICGLFVAQQPSLPMLAPQRPPTATYPGWVTGWFV